MINIKIHGEFVVCILVAMIDLIQCLLKELKRHKRCNWTCIVSQLSINPFINVFFCTRWKFILI